MITSDTGLLRDLGRGSAYPRRNKSWGCMLPVDNNSCNLFLSSGTSHGWLIWAFFMPRAVAHSASLSKLRPVLIQESMSLFSDSTPINADELLMYLSSFFDCLLAFKKNFMNSFPITRGDEGLPVAFELRPSRYRFASASLNLIHPTFRRCLTHLLLFLANI